MRTISAMLLLLLGVAAAWAESSEMKTGEAYYIYNKYYDRLLSHGANAEDAKLSKLGTNAESEYIFDCVESTTSGYFYLKHRSSGLYFAALNKSGNTWSTLLTSTKDKYALWKAGGGRLSCNISSSKFLGIDTGQESQQYISVFYDKDASDRSAWRFIKATGSGYAESLKAADAEDAAAEDLRRNTQVLLTGSTLGLGSSYTIALNDVTFAQTGHATVLLRNTSGKGISFDLYKDHIVLGGKSYSYTAANTLSILITSNNGSIAIKCDGTQVATATAATLDAVTTAGTDCELSILNATALASYTPVIYSRSSVVSEGSYGTDSKGHKTLEVVCVNNGTALDVADDVDVHILSATPFTGTCKVNIAGDRSRLILDNCRPSDAKKMLSNVTVNGSAAVANENCRVGIYLNGTVLFATPRVIFTGYHGEQYQGETIELTATGNANLDRQANEMRSFILRRGYMATLASGEGQGGYTRVYVADHEDLLVPVLPDALNRRVSSVHIKPWQYVSKRGWCSDGRATKGSSLAGNMRSINATWYYNWDANYYNNDDVEYIPMKAHRYWPDNGKIAGHANSTACLLINEPEHSEQHTSSKCTCGGVTNAWNACEMTPSMSHMGMRVGSPAPTDMGWLYEYTGHVDDMAYRCDFVAIHAYWGTNEMPNAQAWKNKLTEIYNKTHRPIWITEWNNGASWTTESWPSGYMDKINKNAKAIKEIVAVFESLDFVERYSIYNWDGGHPRYVINPDDSWVTPAGQAYRDQPSTFAYNAKVQPVPNWWAPSLKSITMTQQTEEGSTTFTITNPNGDLTETLVIERQTKNGEWEEVHSFTERYVFDSEKITVTLPVDEGMYRARLTTVRGASTISSCIVNHDCSDGTNGWTVQNVATNKGEAADGNKENSYFDYWTNKAYTSSMTQTVTGLPRGYYTLTALLRCQEHMTMTLSLASADSKAEVAYKGHDNKQAPGSPYPLGWEDVATSEVFCADGTITITLAVVNPNNAGWWSADNFALNFRPDDSAEIARKEANQAAAQADIEAVEALQAQLSEIIKDNEELIAPEDVKTIETILGDTYFKMIQAALDEVAEEGEYTSPLDMDTLNAALATIAAHIEENKLLVGITGVAPNGKKVNVYDLLGRKTDYNRHRSIIIINGKKTLRR